jgi:hypothetical protein
MGICSSKNVLKQAATEQIEQVNKADDEELSAAHSLPFSQKNVLKSLELDYLDETEIGERIKVVVPQQPEAFEQPPYSGSRSAVLFNILDADQDGLLTRDECHERIYWFIDATLHHERASKYLPRTILEGQADEAAEAEAQSAHGEVVESMMAHAGQFMNPATGQLVQALTYECFVTWLGEFMESTADLDADSTAAGSEEEAEAEGEGQEAEAEEEAEAPEGEVEQEEEETAETHHDEGDAEEEQADEEAVEEQHAAEEHEEEAPLAVAEVEPVAAEVGEEAMDAVQEEQEEAAPEAAVENVVVAKPAAAAQDELEEEAIE